MSVSTSYGPSRLPGEMDTDVLTVGGLYRAAVCGGDISATNASIGRRQNQATIPGRWTTTPQDRTAGCPVESDATRCPTNPPALNAKASGAHSSDSSSDRRDGRAVLDPVAIVNHISARTFMNRSSLAFPGMAPSGDHS